MMTEFSQHQVLHQAYLHYCLKIFFDKNPMHSANYLLYFQGYCEYQISGRQECQRWWKAAGQSRRPLCNSWVQSLPNTWAPHWKTDLDNTATLSCLNIHTIYTDRWNILLTCTDAHQKTCNNDDLERPCHFTHTHHYSRNNREDVIEQQCAFSVSQSTNRVNKIWDLMQCTGRSCHWMLPSKFVH